MLLLLRVHADAFLLDPGTYLRAAGWRLRGLKVRSRNAIAPLTGRSPHAYSLWMRRERVRAARGPAPASPAVMILPVIDCRGGSLGVEETIAALQSPLALPPVTIGGPVVNGAIRIERPHELGRWTSRGGVWVCPLAPGDWIAPDAFEIYAAAVAGAGEARVIYADDDLLLEGARSAPHFKPQWNPDLFRHHDYVTGASIILATDMTTAKDEGWAEDLLAQALGRGSVPVHVPFVLHHRRTRPDPVVPLATAACVKGPFPLVSVIIPTRDQLDLLRTCVEGLKRVQYAQIETIVIDNDSNEPAVLEYLHVLEREGTSVLHIPGPFNYSRLNNAAVSQTKGDLLCFLNNDIEMVDDAWLAFLVQQAQRPEIGAVGARLLYPDGTIQHAGVFTGIGGGAGHGHRFQHKDDPGYFDRARLPQQVSAVTAACLVVARDKFLAVGGFDETDFPVAFNDVDLCLKLNARGWQSFYEPRATLIHHESKSRGSDSAKGNRVRFAGELSALKSKWRTDVNPDPYHHPQLSPFSEQFLVAV
jgi:GT2 family glycosyltransferase